MSGHTNIFQVGWREIPGPSILPDITGGVTLPNVRSDNTTISIWETSGTPRHWQYWTAAAGWSAKIAFPSDYAGGVGWIPDPTAPNPHFASAEYQSGVAGGTAIRVRAMYADGTTSAAAWWPDPSLWNPALNAVVSITNLANDPQQIFPSVDPFVPNMLLNFVSLADPTHLWIPFSLGWGGGIESALLAFNPATGNPESAIYLDVSIQSYIQNFGRTIMLNIPANNPNALTFHPSAMNVYPQIRYNAPYPDFQGAVFGFAHFQTGTLGITGPIFTAIDSATPTTIYGPLVGVRRSPANNISTPYFPNDGVPGFGWDGVLDLTGIQLQQWGACRLDQIVTPFGGIHDDLVSVTPYRSTTGAPNVLGIVYTPFFQGWQGPPIPVAWPVVGTQITRPWFGMIHNGGVYLIDSRASPNPRMFELAVLTTQFAGRYACANWVRMASA